MMIVTTTTTTTNLVEEGMSLRQKLGGPTRGVGEGKKWVDTMKMYCTHVGNPRKKKIWCFVLAIGPLTQSTQSALPELIVLENAHFLKSIVKANPYQIYKGNHFLHSKDKQNKQ